VSKGSKRRPQKVSQKEFSNNWDKIFGIQKKDREELEKMKKKTRDGIPYYDELPSAVDDAADVMSKYDRKR
tara:strand:- start:1045 stop:1257 length:213 start_codon:yes stop_codon:yes gene_type:complete